MMICRTTRVQGSMSGLIFLKFHIRIIKIQNEAKQIRIILSGFLKNLDRSLQFFRV